MHGAMDALEGSILEKGKKVKNSWRSIPKSYIPSSIVDICSGNNPSPLPKSDWWLL
jgi:hypothetical protein